MHKWNFPQNLFLHQMAIFVQLWPKFKQAFISRSALKIFLKFYSMIGHNKLGKNHLRQSFPYGNHCSHQDHGPCCLHVLVFSCTYTLLFWRKIRNCRDGCCPQQMLPQATIHSYIWWDYSIQRIGFNLLTNCTHCLNHVSLSPLNCNHYCFTQS